MKNQQENLRKNITKLKISYGVAPTTLMLLPTKVFAAQGSISTAEIKIKLQKI